MFLFYLCLLFARKVDLAENDMNAVYEQINGRTLLLVGDEMDSTC